MFRVKCPYCGKYDEVTLSLEKELDEMNIRCSSCYKDYNIKCHVIILERGIKENLLRTIPKENVETIHAVCRKYVGKTIKHECGEIEFNESATENIDDNAIMITLSAKNTLYGTSKYRTVKFFVDVDGGVNPRVISEFEWVEKRHFKGETLEAKVDNYINELLVNWHII